MNTFRISLHHQLGRRAVRVPAPGVGELAMLFMDQPFKLDFVWTGLCLVGAVYFVFRT